jgi:hypothetical protein
MDIFQATSSYERWAADQIPIVKRDLLLKHERLAEDPFVFLRGTFYRWLQVWPGVGVHVVNAPVVVAVGDLHVENFGTWRDIEGRLVWGVNDVDEASRLPYTIDLVRLATSATLATRHSRFSTPARDLCGAILEGYTDALARGGRPLVLAERTRWLRRLAVGELRDPVLFWSKFDGLQRATGPVAQGVSRRPPRSPRRVPRLSTRGRSRQSRPATTRGCRGTARCTSRA